MNSKRFNFPSKEVKMFRAKITRCIAAILSVFLVAGVVTPVTASAEAPSPYDELAHLDDAFSYGYGGLLDLRLLEGVLKDSNGNTLSVAELVGAQQVWKQLLDNKANEKPEISNIDIEVLEGLNIDLGGVSLPLLGKDGLLEFALGDSTVGTLREYAHAPSPNSAIGAVGVVSDSGGLEVTHPGTGQNASINILSLLKLQDSSLLNNAITEAKLSLGAISSVAHKPDSGSNETCIGNTGDLKVLDQADFDSIDTSANRDQFAEEIEKICSSYQIADAIVTVKAPALGVAMSTLSSTLQGLLLTVEDGLNVNLSVPGLTKVAVQVDLDEAGIANALIDMPLEDSKKLVSIDLRTGDISIDIKQLHNSQTLNGLAPNSNLVTSDNLSQITTAITKLLTAPSDEESNGLNARLEALLIGDRGTKRGGLYATELQLEVCAVLLVLPVCVTDLKATLGGLLTGATQASSEAIYEQDKYSYFYSAGLLGGLLDGLLGLLLPRLNIIGDLLEDILFGADNSSLGGLLGTLFNGLQTDLLNPVFAGLGPILDGVLAPLAHILVNRQSFKEVKHGSVFIVSALEVNVLGLGDAKLVHLPLATSAVMAQHWDPVDLNINVAKIGDGRELHNGGYSYNLICRIDDAVIFEKSDSEKFTYPESKVGTGYEWQSNSINLLNANETGGLTENVQIPPEAICEITANPSLSDEDFSSRYEDRFAPLRPTGSLDNEDRTPYSYFISSEPGLSVSGAIGEQTKKTVWSPINELSDIDVSSVDDDWKNHSLSFSVPANATEYTVNIVHAYDIDTRDIEVTKIVEPETPENAGPFEFEFSTDGGTTWNKSDPVSITHNGSFIISKVPLINSGSLLPTAVAVRELNVDSTNGGPEVSWAIGDSSQELESTLSGGISTTNSFEAAYGLTPTTTETLPLNLTAKNSYPVNVNFEAMLPKTGQTTLVWVIGLGLLTALGAVIMYVRSRKQ